eukprot:TRINITY_DN13336_c0_g1_i1.p1 TRINITY_DN13336_c0_g1~~TRINITY_DN13336_c0_g1_i1.p1  ORF type:complete len:127 (+),score=64.58 TRINITY_DN13336_c0_g1_i1:44-424(+)
MIRLPPRSTQSRSSAASDVYKRQVSYTIIPPLFSCYIIIVMLLLLEEDLVADADGVLEGLDGVTDSERGFVDLVVVAALEGLVTEEVDGLEPVSYTHLRAHETVLDLVCRLLLEKKKIKDTMLSNN